MARHDDITDDPHAIRAVPSLGERGTETDAVAVLELAPGQHLRPQRSLARSALEGWRSRPPKRAARKRARQDPPGIGPARDTNGLKGWAPEIASGISDAIGWP